MEPIKKSALILDGINAGQRDRARCTTQDDVNWYIAAALANLDETDPYRTGYLHGVNGGE
jgi:hypothetical protein